MVKKTLIQKIKFWQKEQVGKRIQLNVEERQSQNRAVRLEAFLNESCGNKCFMCVQCIKKLEDIVK